MPDTPLRPDELDTYRTDVQTEDVAPEPPTGTPGADARPWMAIGLAILVVFVAMIILALAQVLS
jgi:hypothetical protein